MEIRKILVVDDEEDIRTIARISLATVGKWDVVLASSGQEALALAARESPDLILLDVMMPDMDGATTLAELRRSEKTANTPIVFMTAKVQRQDLDWYRALSAVGVIPKPFDPMTLPDEIRQIVEKVP